MSCLNVNWLQRHSTILSIHLFIDWFYYPFFLYRDLESELRVWLILSQENDWSHYIWWRSFFRDLNSVDCATLWPGMNFQGMTMVPVGIDGVCNSRMVERASFNDTPCAHLYIICRRRRQLFLFLQGTWFVLCASHKKTRVPKLKSMVFIKVCLITSQ